MASRGGPPAKSRQLSLVGDTGDPSPQAPPSVAEDPDLEEVLGPLYETFAAGISRARWPLQAELHASQMLGDLEAILDSEGLLADGQDGLLGLLFHQLAQYAARQRTAAGLAVLRTLVVFADEEYSGEVAAAADALASSGVQDPKWAHTIGRPAVQRCWRLRDVFGTQESIHLVFAYGQRRHGLAVLVDHELGGGVKDSWVTEDVDRMWLTSRRAVAGNPTAVLEQLSVAEAREALMTAMNLDPCPVAPDQVQDVANYVHLLAARLELLAGPDERGDRGGAEQRAAAEGQASAPARHAAGRSGRPREVLQVKVTLKGSKPPIWRRLEVPGDITLDQLHEVILAAFGWHGGHLHGFEAGDRTYADPEGRAAERGSAWTAWLRSGRSCSTPTTSATTGST